MISLIICSRYPDKLDGLKKNVAKTIGTEYEFVIIDNSDNRYNIFSAYNEGVGRSKGDILCFMHEDLVFHSKKWGNRVITHLDNNEIGLIGVAGGFYLPNIPIITLWDSVCTSHMIQGITVKNKYYRLNSLYTNNTEKKKALEVVAVDGFWFCIKKSMFENIRFDDNTFHDFHCYDLDICMQVLNQNLKIVVVFDILIEHKSSGNANESFYDEKKLWHKKWEHCLPKTCINTPQKYLSHDWTIEDYFLERAKNLESLYKSHICMSHSIWLQPRNFLAKIYHLIMHN